VRLDLVFQRFQLGILQQDLGSVAFVDQVADRPAHAVEAGLERADLAVVRQRHLPAVVAVFDKAEMVAKFARRRVMRPK
jgi:hypothetical protein